MAVESAPLRAVGALSANGTAGADCGRSLIGACAGRVVIAAEGQDLPARAEGDILLGVVSVTGMEARIPASSRRRRFSPVPYAAAAMTRWGWSFQRNETRRSKSDSGVFSRTSAGVTRAAKMIRALPPSTT